MTPEEIIAMAKEAGIDFEPLQSITGKIVDFTDGSQSLGRMTNFAALVAAKERERFALECIDVVAFHGGSVELEEAIRARGQKEGA